MLGGKDLSLLVHGHMGVDLGGGNGAMTEEMLDVLDIDISFQEESGKGMPEGVWGDVLLDVGQCCEFADDVPHRLVGEGSAQPVDKERCFFFHG